MRPFLGYRAFKRKIHPMRLYSNHMNFTHKNVEERLDNILSTMTAQLEKNQKDLDALNIRITKLEKWFEKNGLRSPKKGQ